MEFTRSEKVTSAQFSQATDFQQVAGSLRPTTSNDSGRYDGATQVVPVHSVIPSGFSLSSKEAAPSYLPPNWEVYTHPEGQVYFYRQSTPRIVTAAFLYRSDVAEKVVYWSQFIEQRLLDEKIVLSNDVELFLQIDGNDCAYYFVDHVSHTQLWLDPMDTEDLNLSGVMSPSHLKLALEDLYWLHVENFPMHLGGLPSKSLDDLICIFSHGLTDRMTSNDSTFPYSVKECNRFLKLLRSSRDQLTEGHTTCVIARLWTVISRYRFSVHYGEEHARLSRDRPILIEHSQESLRIAILTSRLSFGLSEAYRSRLNGIYIDRYVYEEHWRIFMSSCLQDWKNITLMAFLALILHISLVFIPTVPALAITSTVFFGVSLISSILLVHRHESLAVASAFEALMYLNGVCSTNCKFQMVAFVYSLPKAAYFWGLGAFSLNWVIFMIQHVGIGIGAGILGAIVVTFIASHRATSQSAWTFDYRCPRFFAATDIPEINESLV